MSAFKAPPFLDGTFHKLQTSWQDSMMLTLNFRQIKATSTKLTVSTVLACISKSISPTYERFPRTQSHITCSRVHDSMQCLLVDRVTTSDEEVEDNLSTIFQQMRGSKQYWFLRCSEVMFMVREYGSPTLFLTLSCGEYDSLDIATYLRTVNDVPDSYPIGKLCTEDPVSVSRKFSQKFHDFFQTVIIKGQVLGCVSHYFFKKEYQARGAPHYHILLWIDGAPLAGTDSNDKVLQCIQAKITCRIPEENSNAEQHQLVTKYQCNSYCQ